LFSVIAIVAVTVLAYCGPAAADDKETCKTASGEEAIDACSRAIESKKYKGRNLSLIYTNRGVEYGGKGENDRAIADHDQAIKLDPKNALAFNNRGNVYGTKGDNDRAIADYDQAIKLNPKYAAAFYNRGIAKKKKADLAGGDADIAQARQLQPGIGNPQ
jgi:tetratricopeptide (TPR) repeat protein